MERSRLFNHYVVDVIPWKQSKVMIFQCRVFKLITLTHPNSLSSLSTAKRSMHIFPGERPPPAAGSGDVSIESLRFSIFAERRAHVRSENLITPDTKMNKLRNGSQEEPGKDTSKI
uniref:Uncharacterized protein n=1 Tax=Solanum lycopersicum TaxID=4081 RepID=A0A3Q7JDC9_SOLLC